MERLVGAHAEWQSLDVASRLSRLETIVVCRPSFTPSVDEVLDKLAESGLRIELEQETFPCNIVNSSNATISSPPQPLVYDIGESNKSVAVQTNAMPKPRKHRCHGRACQTEEDNILQKEDTAEPESHRAMADSHSVGETLETAVMEIVGGAACTSQL